MSSGIIILIAALVGYAIGSVIGYWAGVDRMKRNSVEAGHAEWVVTGPDGSTEFRWKDHPEQAETEEGSAE